MSGRIRVETAAQAVRVTLNGETLAESARPRVMHEGSYPPVYYFPRADVRMDRLSRSSHRTTCPYKGEASYYSAPGVENLAWSYEDPIPAAEAIRGHLAFYPDKVTFE